jgi:recombinational DNA repair protein (RecF pathway)
MRQLQLPVDDGFSERALRRCHGCGEYARPATFDRQRNMILCERCAERARRGGAATSLEAESDPTKVDFTV